MSRPDVFLEHFPLVDGEGLPTSFVLDACTFDIGIPVIKWCDAGGFDGYARNVSVETSLNRKTGRIKRKRIAGKRYGMRTKGSRSISQIMIHHTGGDGDGAGNVFNTLHNQRGLSVHFVIDDDGTIWQFLDCAEKAWHAGGHNNISVGIECNLYPLAEERPDYYSEARRERFGNLPHEIVEDEIHGRKMRVFQMPEPQREALAKLCAGIWVALGAIAGDEENKDRDGALGIEPLFPRIRRTIPRTEIARPKKHIGMIGHLQATKRKIDPAGFPWEDFERRVAMLFSDYTALWR